MKSVLGNKMASDESRNRRKRKKDLELLHMRSVAKSYLTNITLDGQIDNRARVEQFEKMIANDLDLFLSLNNMTTTPDKQSDYFNYYKQKRAREKRSEKRSQMETFLFNEFDEVFESSRYVSEIIDSSGLTRPSGLPSFLPAINIVPSQTSDSVALMKSMADPAELEYLESCGKTNAATVGAPTHKLAQSLNLALMPSKPPGRALSKSPTINENDTPSNNEKNATSTNRMCRRTISESSNDSTSLTYLKLNLSNNSYYNTRSGATGFNYKSSLFSNLKKLNNEKLVFTSNGAPLGVFSRLPFKLSLSGRSDLNESFMKTRHISMNKAGSTHNSFIVDVFQMLELDYEDFSNTGVMSYANLIDKTIKSKEAIINEMSEKSEDGHEDEKEESNVIEIGKQLQRKDTTDVAARLNLIPTAVNQSLYHPDYLDDPQLTELTAGKNRTCLKFTSYSVSLIDYVKPLDLKKEINETFKEKFPHVQITLTKLRSIKRELYEIACEIGLDSVIIAHAYIYFEKLILQGLINKQNRKYLAADCLILAAKLNDVTKKELNKLIDSIIDKFRFDNRKDLMAYEFGIVVALEFNLIVKYEPDFMRHYDRIITTNETTLSSKERSKIYNLKSFND